MGLHRRDKAVLAARVRALLSTSGRIEAFVQTDESRLQDDLQNADEKWLRERRRQETQRRA